MIKENERLALSYGLHTKTFTIAYDKLYGEPEKNLVNYLERDQFLHLLQHMPNLSKLKLSDGEHTDHYMTHLRDAPESRYLKHFQ